MLSNVEVRENLRSLARARARENTTKTVRPREVDEFLEQGWVIEKRSQKTARLNKPKAHGTLLEDRVWTLMYRMGFVYLSAAGGAQLRLDPKSSASPINQIDVVAIDDDVAIAIECKSSATPNRRPEFQEELAKHSIIRQRFVQAVNDQYSHPSQPKHQVALAMFLHHVVLSEPDRQRAQNANVAIFDDQDLEYYEELVRHLGVAARYQFLADVLPGKNVPGLQIKVPAIRTKMGGYACYTFSISPSYLLKICYVSHRMKGKPSDVNAYQRMIKKYRLRSLRDYIDDNGIFPTNIVINLDRKPTFERGEQASEQDSGTFGWLTLRPAYKSAWIIDGQHRLFAYSGHPRAEKSSLAVLAFENLSEDKQAQLFIDINAQQKSVKQSLLLQLDAELRWSSTDPQARVRAAISKAIETLDRDPESPFFQRILWADGKADNTRCISLTSIARALQASELYIAPTKKEDIIEYGPLWGGNNEATRQRTTYILKRWFGAIRDAAPDWWTAGKGEGGGLAMNDSVVACVQVLRSVCQHLSTSGMNLLVVTDEALFKLLAPFASALASYLSSLSEEERKHFRDLRGTQGQTTRTKRCQLAIHEQMPTFMPYGLRDFMETELAQTNPRARAMVEQIRELLRSIVFDELKREFGAEDTEWWMEGVPRAIRSKIAKRREDDNGRLGDREAYFDFLDYRAVIQENWDTFGSLLGIGKVNVSKARRTSWIADVNEVHKIVSSPASGRSVSLDQLAKMEDYQHWLENQASADSDAPAETA